MDQRTQKTATVATSAPVARAAASAESLTSAKTAEDDAFEHYQDYAPRVREILRQYRKKRKLSAIAVQVGVSQARLAEMINKNSDGHYKRRITLYYLSKFLDTGIMTVEQLLGGRSIKDLPDRVGLFFERHILSRKTIRLIVEAQRRGINVDGMLEMILYPDGQDRH